MITRFSDLQIDKPCGGNGTCHKCRIRFIENAPEPTEADLRAFTEEELRDGFRLACQVSVETDARVEVSERLLASEMMQSVTVDGKFDVKNMQSITDDGRSTAKDTQTIVADEKSDAKNPIGTAQVDAQGCEGNIKNNQLEKLTLAIDLGTTTIAFALYDGARDTVFASYGMANPQRVFGADVISRIKAANEGAKGQLQQLVCDALAEGYEHVVKMAGIDTVSVRRIFIGGNVTMIHLLLGMSTEGLGAYPFTAVDLAPGAARLENTAVDLAPGAARLENTAVDLAPGVARLGDIEITFAPAYCPFVGGDIAAGVYGLGMCEKTEKSLLIDLGTNGELAFFDGEKLYVASTAAGPAFEGANLSCGVASIAGAIYDVRLPYHNATPLIQTIGNQKPIGLCGTGAISAISTLRRFHLIDEHGTFTDEYRETGFVIAVDENEEKILLSQEDLRAIQMAKAAIAAGVELLLQEASCAIEDLDHIYLAGGMGQFLSVDDAITLGLLPQEAKDKTAAVGNSCMRGLLRMAKCGCEEATAYFKSTQVVTIELANVENFEARYVAHMDLP